MRTADLYLNDIVESIDLIQEYIIGIDFEKFETSFSTQDAVFRRLEIIGEAVKCIPSDFKKLHPEVPWRRIGSFRDILAHEYFGIKLDRVWEILGKDIIDLRSQIEKLINHNVT